MAGISLSGLASGLDWKSLVDQLMAAEQIPVSNLQADKSAGAKKITTLGTLSGDLTALQTSLKSLTADDVFTGRSAKIADSTSTWSATAAAGTNPGRYSFNVTKLATTAQRAGTPNTGAGISTTDVVTGLTLATMNISTAITAGSFTVNGKKIDIALTDSLDSVLQKMADGTGITAGYNHLTDTVSLKSINSGDPILIGSAGDTSNILTALKLYNTDGADSIESRTPLGVPSLNATIENANLKLATEDVDTDGKGTFSINGIPIDFNTKTDSIQAVMNRINASTAGVTAAYDKSGDKFTLTNKVTGNMGLTVSEDAKGFLKALGITSTAGFAGGQNAEFTLNGGDPIVSTSNNFSSDVTGIQGLSVNATDEKTQVITVGNDITGARSKIDDFISKYNIVQDYIDAQTKITIGTAGKVTLSTLSDNQDIDAMGRTLRSMAFGAVPGLTGTIKRLADMGIDFKSDTSDLQVIDSAKLTDALTNNSDAVSTLFRDSSHGLITQFDTYVTNITGTEGMLAHMTESLNKESTSLDAQIARMNTQIEAERARLTAGFVAMELAQSNIQSQATAFNNAFGTNSTTTK